MGNKNTNLQVAKRAKDDEFYTTYETVEQEVLHYVDQFKNKTVLCNCDDPFESNFCRFFLRNFNVLKLKRLICTSYYSSKVIATKLSFDNQVKDSFDRKNGYVLDVTKFCNDNAELSDEYITNFLLSHKVIKMLNGDGDFRSSECIE